MADKIHIDELFREAFEKFEQLPPADNWADISGILDSGLINHSTEGLESGVSNEADLQLDQTFKKAFRDFESLPPDHAWTSIQKQIPLNLFVKNHLTRLSKLAALLLISFALIFILGYAGLIDRINQRFEKPVKPAVDKNEKTTADIFQLDQAEDISNSENEAQSRITEELTPISAPDNYSTIIAENNGNVLEGETISGVGLQRNTFKKEVPAKNPSGQIELNNSDRVPLTGIEQKTDEKGPNFSVDESAGVDLSKDLNAGANSDLFAVHSLPLAGIVLPFMSFTEPSVELQSEADWREQKLLSAFEENAYFENALARSTDDLRIMESMSYKGIYLSVLTGINNSWIISETLRNEIGGDGEAKYVLDMGTTLGAGIGYQFNPAISLEAAWIHARQGQRYQNLGTSGVYKTGDLSTIYHYFPLQLKWQAARMRNSGKMPMTWNYVFGVHYGRRNSAVLKSDEEGLSLDEYLVSNELGMSLGIELRLFIDPTLFLSLGGYGRAGAEASAIFGSQTYHSTNLNIGLQLGVNYRLSR